MKLILLTFLLVMIAVVSVGVARRRREHRRAKRAKLARRAVESPTGAHSYRVSEPLRYRSHADNTGFANQTKPVFHLIFVEQEPVTWPGSLPH